MIAKRITEVMVEAVGVSREMATVTIYDVLWTCPAESDR